MLCRLRQICDSSALVTVEPPTPPETPSSNAPPGAALPPAQQQELVLKLTELVAAGALDECPICMDDVTVPVITPCAHVFCRACLDSWLLNGSKGCPMCRAAISKTTVCEVPPDALPPAGAQEVRRDCLRCTSVSARPHMYVAGCQGMGAPRGWRFPLGRACQSCATLCLLAYELSRRLELACG